MVGPTEAPLRFFLAALAVLLLTVATGASTAGAAAFTVNSTVDAVDASPGDGVCATASGQCTLRAAIQEANALPGRDIITLPSGTYTMTIGGQGESASATGSFDIKGDLQIHGDGSSSTVIDGAYVDGLIQVLSGNVVISDVTLERGGHLLAPFGDIVNFKSGNLTINNSVITGGQASGGAGILNGGTLTVNGSTITRNAGAPPGESSGGGIYNSGSMTLIDSAITHNYAGQGGGIYSAGTASLTNITISQNVAFDVAAGIVAQGDITLTNVTISGNGAYADAGGVYNFGTARLTNVTISDNTSRYGTGGIINEGTAILKNTIVSNNTFMSRGYGNCTGSHPITSKGHNLEDADTCDLNGPGDLRNTDPKLGPLADNGGPTQTHALLPGSPAIDAGSTDCPLPATDQRGVLRPQDGDGNGIAICDIGAYEFEPPQPAPTPTSTSSATSTNAPAGTVAPARLPATGASPTGQDSLPLAVVVAGESLVIGGIAVAFVARRRRC